MPANYTGSAAATQSPAVPASSGLPPVLALPIGTDAFNSAAFYQSYKVLADYIAYIQSKISLGPPPVGDTPQLRFYDTAGNLRSLIDHNGYPMGRRSEIREEWIFNTGSINASATPIVAAQKWSAVVSVGSIVLSPPTATYPATSVKLTTGGSAGQSLIYSAAPIIHTGNAFQSTVIEFEAGSSSATDAAHSLISYFGLTDQPSIPGTLGNACWFKNIADGSHPNWICETSDGAAILPTNSGVAIGAATAPTQRFRIELHGSTSPYASKARFFINEVLVATNTTNLPTSAALSLVFGGVGASLAPSLTSYVGPVLVTWNRALSIASL